MPWGSPRAKVQIKVEWGTDCIENLISTKWETVSQIQRNEAFHTRLQLPLSSISFRLNITGRVKMWSKAAWTTWSCCPKSQRRPSWRTWRNDTWTTTSLYPFVHFRVLCAINVHCVPFFFYYARLKPRHNSYIKYVGTCLRAGNIIILHLDSWNLQNNTTRAY